MFDIVASRATFAQSLQNMRQKPFRLESIVIIAIIIILACFWETKAHFEFEFEFVFITKMFFIYQTYPEGCNKC